MRLAHFKIKIVTSRLSAICFEERTLLIRKKNTPMLKKYWYRHAKSVGCKHTKKIKNSKFKIGF